MSKEVKIILGIIIALIVILSTCFKLYFWFEERTEERNIELEHRILHIVDGKIKIIIHYVAADSIKDKLNTLLNEEHFD